MGNNLKYFYDNYLDAIENGSDGVNELKFLFKAIVLEIRCVIATGSTTDID